MTYFAYSRIEPSSQISSLGKLISGVLENIDHSPSMNLTFAGQALALVLVQAGDQAPVLVLDLAKVLAPVLVLALVKDLA